MTPVGSTTGTPSIDIFAAPGAPISTTEWPVSETEADAPGAKVCASTVVPLDDVTLIQQSAVVAPTVSEYVDVTGTYVADDGVELAAVYLGGTVVGGVRFFAVGVCRRDRPLAARLAGGAGRVVRTAR